MSAEHVRVQDELGVRTITLARPEAKNALTQAAKARFCELVSEFERTPTLRVAIITGVDPAFCSGVDFKEFAAAPGNVAPTAWNAFDAQFSTNPGRVLRALTKPAIAAVNGPCVSGGLEIALSCSFVVASERASFRDTHARLGAVATWGLTALLPRAVGIRRAREMSVTGRAIDAATACAWGIANHVVAHDELLAFARTLAGEVSELPTVGETLQLYARGDGLSLAEALDLEQRHTATRSFDADEFQRRGTRDRSGRAAGASCRTGRGRARALISSGTGARRCRRTAGPAPGVEVRRQGVEGPVEVVEGPVRRIDREVAGEEAAVDAERLEGVLDPRPEDLAVHGLHRHGEARELAVDVVEGRERGHAGRPQRVLVGVARPGPAGVLDDHGEVAPVGERRRRRGELVGVDHELEDQISFLEGAQDVGVGDPAGLEAHRAHAAKRDDRIWSSSRATVSATGSPERIPPMIAAG